MVSAHFKKLLEQPEPRGSVKKDKPREGAARPQKRRGGPGAVAPVGLEKTRTAPPSIKRGPGRPAGPARVAILVKVPPEMIGRLERTQAKKKIETRNDTIVALLDEGAEK